MRKSKLLSFAAFTLIFSLLISCSSDPKPTPTVNPPVIANFLAAPDPVDPGANVTFTVDVTAGTNDLAAVDPVTLDLTNIGGSATQAMSFVAGLTTAGQTSSWTFTFAIPQGNTLGLTPGDYSVTVTASDNLGTPKTGIDTIADLTINNLAPVLNVTNQLAPLNAPYTITAEVVEPNSLADVASVTIDLTTVGGSATQQMYDDGTNGDVTPDDGTFSIEYTVTSSTGVYNLGVVVTDQGTLTDTDTIVLTVVNIVYVGPARAITTIQAGIDAASTGESVIVDDATYTGAGNVNLQFNGKDIILSSANGAANCIIDCQGSSTTIVRAFYFSGTAETNAAIIDGFTIENGYVDGTAPSGANGGAIYLSTSSPTFKNCLIRNNTSTSQAGAVFANASSAVFENCVIDSNAINATSTSFGAGFRIEGSSNITLTDCVISNNSNTTTAWALGGGMYSMGAVTLTNCFIFGNSTNSTGSVESYGGGLNFEGSSSNATLNNCTITGNQSITSGGSSYGGGGLFIYWGSTTINNSIIYGNTSDVPGNEFWINNSVNNTVTLNYCDFDNSANDVVDPGSRMTANNCINSDPLLVTGPNGDYYLEHNGVGGGAADSPCINAGSDTAANLGLDTYTTRVDGVVDSGRVDIGAHYTP